MTENNRIEIEKIISDGRGIGRKDGMTFLVRRSAPLDIVFVSEDRVKKNYTESSILSFEKVSPVRTNPKCRYYDLCGGCGLQHIKPEIHKEIKTAILRELLLKNAKTNYTENIEYISGEFFNYRNKITLSVQNNRIGLLRENSNSIVDIEECLICADEINKIIKDIRNKIVYDNRINKIVLKKSRSGKTLAAFYTDYAKKENYADFIKEINADNIIIILKDKSAVYVKGKGLLTDMIDGKIFSYTYSTFMQVNTSILDKITEHLKNSLSGGKTFIDLYSGVGIYSILFSDRFKETVSVESNKSSVYFHRKNLSENRIANVNVVQKFIDGKMHLDDDFFETCLIDPPREGVHPIAMKNILDSVSKQIIYISCDAATLARDLRMISGSGFEIKDIKIFDMFPNTIHFETVVVLKKKL